LEERVIGTYEGDKKGALLIVLGGIHGNEAAGILALEELFRMLEEEPRKNSRFAFIGKVMGVRGNLRAIKVKERFISKDLNRQWIPENIKRVLDAKDSGLDAEDLELRGLVQLIRSEVGRYQPDELIVLDLHTTTADGGIFTIVSEDAKSIEIGLGLNAPVIRGMLEGIAGTSMHYFNTDNFSCPTTALAFESGQHDDPMSVARAVAALVSCLRATGMVRPEDVEHRHDQLLKDYARHLPPLTKLVAVHPILPGDDFVMKSGYVNFQLIKKGEILAHDKRGKILAPMSGRILMPLYQPRGEDGFFIVQEIKN